APAIKLGASPPSTLSGLTAPAADPEEATPWNSLRYFLVCAVCFAAFVPAYVYFQSRVGVEITDATQLAAGKAVWREDATLSWMHRAVGLGMLPPLLFMASAAKARRLRGLVL